MCWMSGGLDSWSLAFSQAQKRHHSLGIKGFPASPREPVHHGLAREEVCRVKDWRIGRQTVRRGPNSSSGIRAYLSSRERRFRARVSLLRKLESAQSLSSGTRFKERWWRLSRPENIGEAPDPAVAVELTDDVGWQCIGAAQKPMLQAISRIEFERSEGDFQK